MHLRISRTKRNGRSYAYGQLVQSYRRDDGMPAQRVIAHLGKLTPIEILNLRVALKAARQNQVAVLPAAGVSGASVLANYEYLNVATVLALWREWRLGDLMDRLLPTGDKDVRYSDVIAALVVQRCVRPRSKLSATRWYPKTALPELLGVTQGQFNNSRIHRILDAMDASMDERLQDALVEQYALQKVASCALFIDLTDTWFFGRGPQMAKPGKTKEGLYRRKVGIALVCNDDGFPMRWRVVHGRQAEPKTMLQLLETARHSDWLGQRPVVCDRAMGTTKYLQQLTGLDVRYLTAMKRNEFDAYTDQIPYAAVQAIDWQQDDAEDKAGQAVTTLMHQEADGLYVLDLGKISRGVVRSPELPSTEDKTVEVMRLVQEMDADLNQGRANTYREVGRRHGLKKEYTAKLLRLRHLAPDLQEDILAGGAIGLSLAALKRIAAQANPVRQRSMYNDALDRARRSKPDGRASRPRGTPKNHKEPFEVHAVVTFNPRVFVEQQRNAADKLARVEATVRRLCREQKDPETWAERITALLAKENLKNVYTIELGTDCDGKPTARLHLDESEWRRRRRFDGFRLMVCHPDLALTAGDIVRLYRHRDTIEKDFQTIKSAIHLRPVHHRRDDKVRAHVTLCILALLLERTLEKRLREAGRPMSAPAALELLDDIHLNLMDLPDAQGVYELTQATVEQKALLQEVGMGVLLEEEALAATIHPR